jgi:hypothetical protein
MNNIFLLLAAGLVEILCLVELVALKKEWYYAFIVVNLILVTLLGSKIISFFSYSTNTGNIFYLSAVLGSLILLEVHGRRSAFLSVPAGILGVGFFVIMVEFVMSMSGTGVGRELDQAMFTLFSDMPRVAFSSLSSLALTLPVGIYLLDKLKGIHVDRFVRILLAVIVSQILDSIIFFSLAFFGTISPSMLAVSILTGFCVKMGFVLIASPFILVRLNVSAKT